MIVYTQIETLARDLGVCARTLYALSNAPQRHYHKAVLRKKDGGTRTLLVPDEPTKIVQRAILSNLLSREPVSPAAAAYRPAFGPERGARLHVGAKKVLTLDVRGFFDHIRYPDVKKLRVPEGAIFRGAARSSCAALLPVRVAAAGRAHVARDQQSRHAGV